ncbi:hypothetical protein ABZ498_15135 [Streptomyces lavendulocolor]|uniref:hypothetical protein n=1 Tax=Streptomyces lavendulocolor TaxID=67316 RepID=UPI00340E0414
MKPPARLPRPLLCVTAAVATALVGCGTVNGTGTGPGAGSGAVSAGRTGGGADRSELESRARAAQVAIENVYVTDVPGFDPAEQSAGVIGDDGFSVTYVQQGTGAHIRLGVERGSMDAAGCPRVPLGDGGTGGAVKCTADGGRWYRTGGARHEYATVTDGRLVRLDADLGTVDRATLRKAAEAAHPASDAELGAVLPEARPGGGAPVERGDLPPVGDGAPDNDVDAGG